MKKYCLALDLKNDPELIKEYEEYHKNPLKRMKDKILAGAEDEKIDIELEGS